jgi:hypothetical protein
MLAAGSPSGYDPGRNVHPDRETSDAARCDQNSADMNQQQPPDESQPRSPRSEQDREVDVDWALMDPTITQQERGLAILDAISDSLRPPHRWQGDQLTIMGVRFYWHPKLGYITIPDDGDPEP